MARSRKVNYFAQISSDEDFDELLQKKGLISQLMNFSFKNFFTLLNIFQFLMFIKNLLVHAQ